MATQSASDRRAERELKEARQAGNAPAEVDVKTGAIINPHNPEFITKKPWYLADGGDAGPTLDHQADQRRDEEKRGISLAESDRLVKEERERIKRKLEKQKRKSKKKSRRSHGDEDDDAELYELGMWIEALKKNKKPYLIAQIVKISEKGKCFDLKYEDGYLERNVRPWDKKKQKSISLMNVPRMRVTKTGSRTTNVTQKGTQFGKETYDSKRDSYHGVEIDGHMKKMEEKYRKREALRKEQRKKQRKLEEEERQKEKEQQDKKEKPSDSDSDSDSDSGKSALVLFWHVILCVQYDVSVILPLHLTLALIDCPCIPHILTYVTTGSLHLNKS